MGRKHHSAEQIIGKLRIAEIELAKGLGTVEFVLISQSRCWFPCPIAHTLHTVIGV
jgi:hypothetical protein